MWRPEIYRFTRSQVHSVKDSFRHSLVLTPWILEPLFGDDLLVYTLAGEDMLRMQQAFRQESQSIGVRQAVRRLMREGGGGDLWDEPVSITDPHTGAVVDTVGILPDGRPVILTPWSLTPVGRSIDTVKKRIMHWVETVCGVPCFWVSIRTVRQCVPIGSSEIRLDRAGHPEPPPISRWRAVPLLLSGSMMRDDAPETYPNLKMSYPYLPSTVGAGKAAFAAEKNELSLLPYLTTDIRRRCHEAGIVSYLDRRLLPILTENATAGLRGFALPWLDLLHSSCPNGYRVMRPDRLEEFRRWSAHQRPGVYIDFETLEGSVIYLCGLYDASSGVFHSIWSRDPTDLTAENNLMRYLVHLIDTAFRGRPVLFYCAERNMWKTACRRQGLSLDDEITRLLDGATDLYAVMRSSGILLREAPNLKLKTVGKALHRRGDTDVAFPETEITNGEDSMIMAQEMYRSAPPRSLVEGVDHTVGEPSDHATNAPRRALWLYNRYDCLILAEIQRWILSLETPD